MRAIASCALRSGMFVGIACLSLTGAMTLPSAVYAATCGDGIVEGGEECDPGGPRTVGATADGAPCTSGGQCFFVNSGGCCKFNCQAVGSGLACDDHNPCSIGSKCNQVGVCACAGGCDPAAGVGSICHVSTGECDPEEICQANTGCPVDTKAAAGTACTADANPCTADKCNGSSAACQHPAGNAGVVCRPSAAECDAAEQCSGSSATCPPELPPTGAPCTDDGNVCTNDVCDAGSTCTHPENTAPCSDGVFCNGNDVCNAGACTHSGDPCSTGSECADTCNEVAGNCFDAAGTACTADSNVCTDDKCNGSGVCAHPNNTAPCVGSLFCRVNEVCGGGACGGGGPRDCSDSNICTTDSCNEGADRCDHLTDNGQNGQQCDDNNLCTVATSCSSGLCGNGSQINCDDNTACTTDSCAPELGCVNTATVENRTCNSCEDGVDNDDDQNVDFEDSGCATLWRDQRFALASSSSLGKRSKRLFLGGDVLVDSTAGTLPGSSAPYPLGPSLAGVCGNDMKVLAGVTAGLVATQHINADQKGVEFGLGEMAEKLINIRREYVSNGGPESLKGSAPLVGPGICSDDGVTVCSQASDLCSSAGNLCCSAVGALCEGQMTLVDVANPHVDRSGAADNFIRCQSSLQAQLSTSLGILTLAGNVDGYRTADAAEIKLGAGNPVRQITLGGGLQVLEVKRVKLSGNTELQLLGQEDTVLVVRVQKQLKTGGGGKLILGSNGLGMGSLRADHILWSVEGRKGGKVNLKRATIFKGTILAPERGCLIGGAVDLEGALSCQSMSNGATRVLHAPFTPCLTPLIQGDCNIL